MNDNQRNTRTLIVSFVVAIMALVPLRMIEIGQTGIAPTNVAVLGEQISLEDSDWVPMEELAELDREAPIIEAPYQETEERGCLVPEVVEVKTMALMEEIDRGNLSQVQINENLDLIAELQSVVCR